MTDDASPAATPDRDRPPGIPRWVKAVAAVGLVIVLLAAGLALAGGEHGPGRHLDGDDPAPARTAPPDGGGGHVPPPGAHE